MEGENEQERGRGKRGAKGRDGCEVGEKTLPTSLAGRGGSGEKRTVDKL